MPSAAVDSQIGVVRTIKALRARLDAWKSAGHSVSLVPTMGALHEGHLSLVRRSISLGAKTVASIFVNPAQFAPHEDFGSYPRQEARDLELLQKAGCSLAYIPSREEMYPEGFQTSVAVSDISQGLCGGSRPHFFGGVATVVCKLLNQARPDFAVFGEKDYQQLLVIRRMVKDLNMPVEIVGGEIVRESDGLAMSSRNAYLSASERTIAGSMNKIISEMAARLERGEAVDATLTLGREKIIAAGFTAIDYLDVRSAATLAPLGPGAVETSARVFAATILGKTRLIDNWPVEVSAE